MLPLWFYLGHRFALPWTWWLGVPAITWVCLFIVVDRIRHKQQPSEPGEPLLRLRAGVACAGGASDLVAAKRVLVVPAADYHFLPGILRPGYLAASGCGSFRSPGLRSFSIRLYSGGGSLHLLDESAHAVRLQLEPRRGIARAAGRSRRGVDKRGDGPLRGI